MPTAHKLFSAFTRFSIRHFRLVSLVVFFPCVNPVHAGTTTGMDAGSKLSAGIVTVSPAKIYDNDVAGGAAGRNHVVTIQNTSANSPLSLTGISLSGANAAQFQLGSLPSFPKVLAAQESITFTVAFDPSSVGIKTAVIDIASDDATQPVVSVLFRGLGTAGTGGTNEPSLQMLLNLYEIPVTVGDDDAATNIINSSSTQQKAPLLGEETSLQKFAKAGTGPVTIEPLAVFGPTSNNPVVGAGWYVSGDINSKTELFTVSNSPASNGQTVNPPVSGTLSFDPGSAMFGFYSRWPFFSNRHLYSEDNLNTFTGAIPHHVRVYPYKDQNGSVVPFAYIVAFEENTSGFDYQDLVFIVRNVTPAIVLAIGDRDPVPSANRSRKIEVYPNPVRQKFTVNLPGAYSGTASLQLIDEAGVTYELGKTNVRLNGSQVTVDVSKQTLRPGIYFLRLSVKNRSPQLFKLLIVE